MVGLDAVSRTRLVTDVANALDAALWDGAGTSNTIKGILRATGIATGTLDLTDPDQPDRRPGHRARQQGHPDRIG